MPINFRISALVPVGLIVESVAQLDDTIACNLGPVLVTARAGIQGGDMSSVWIAFAAYSRPVCL